MALKKHRLSIMNLSTPCYTTTDVARLGIKRERLKEWTTRGFVSPSVRAAGPGTKALFSLLDLYHIKLFEKIVKLGFFRECAAELLKHKAELRLVLAISSDAKYLVFAKPYRIYIGVDAAFDLSDCSNRDYILIVNFEKIRTEIGAALRLQCHQKK